MFGLFKKSSRKRSIYFHEDDYCRQQVLPQAALTTATAELSAVQDFAEAHRSTSGIGWTDVYIRSEDYAGISSIALHRDTLDSRLSQILGRFDEVCTGYSSHREVCKRTWAWGSSDRCALFADWNDEMVVQNIWTEFFDSSETAIDAATHAVTAISPAHSLFFIDWAWDYVCPVSDSSQFKQRLAQKLTDINERQKQFQQGG